MMDQHEWVAGCLAYYAEAGMDPEPGWEEAHYPIPKCLGGTETVWLTWEHHQVQGLLQSEEYGCVCFYAGDVKRYLEDKPEREDLWGLYRKWTRENGKKTVKMMNEHPNTRESQRENGRKTGVENGRENGRKNASKMLAHPNTVENRREITAKMNSQRWKCLATGYESNPGGLSTYQKARGIDTSMRERVA